MRSVFIRHPGHPFDPDAFRARGATHLRRWGLVYLGVAIAAGIFPTRYTLGINISPSLPHHVYLIHKGTLPNTGDLVAFRWGGGGPYAAETTFVKIVAGVAADTVTRVEREFFVNGKPVGTAKQRSRTGVLLDPGPTGVLPAGTYYVRAPHPDSLDSRYALTGWISRNQIIGRAYVLF